MEGPQHAGPGRGDQAAAAESRLEKNASAPPRIRKAAIAMCALTVALLSSAAWFWSLHSDGVHRTATSPAAAATKTFQVNAAPSSEQVTILGIVAAGRSVPIIASFDGVIRDKKMQLGDRVAAGDVLIVMDAGEIQTRLREAQSGLLKAAMALDALSHWDSSPDVTRARRTLEGAEASLASLERQVSETKGLLDRGIVSRNEYQNLVQQRDSQKLVVAGAQQDLSVTASRGGSDGRRLAELDLENAKARLADLQQQIDGTILRAQAAGILLRPPANLQNGAALLAVEAGTRVQRGQALFTIADMTSLIVIGKIDEVDVNQIRLGQSVTITSDAFPGARLPGRIIGVSTEAEQDATARAPTFSIRAAIAEMTDARRSDIRIGMSARMTINLDAKSDVLIVPIDAVQRQASGAIVKIQDPRTGARRDQQVTLGSTRPDGIEIISGVKAGDVLVRP
jgi:HlyD family secretion protein